MSSWMIDPKTGDYVMTNGAPTSSDRLLEPAYYRLKTKRGQWLYAPNDQYGSDFFLIKKRFAANDLTVFKNIAEKAVDPIVEDKRAISATASISATQYSSRNDVAIDVQIVDAQGQVQNLNLPILGGQ